MAAANYPERGGFARVVMREAEQAQADAARNDQHDAAAVVAAAVAAGRCMPGDDDSIDEHEQESTMEGASHVAHDDSQLRRPSSSSSGSALGRLRRAAQVVAAPQLMAKADVTRLKPVIENLGTLPLLATAVAVPAFWIKRDAQDHKFPSIIYNLLELGITDSKPESELLESELSLNTTDEPGPEPSAALGGASVAGQHRGGGNTVFRIELRYGQLKWVIYRKMIDFVKLHSRLTAKYIQGKIHALPSFPKHMDYALDKLRFLDLERSAKVAADRRQAFENYLLEMLRNMSADITYEISEFLEISALSIAPDQGWKGKEGYLEVYHEGKGSGFWLKRHWKKRWVVVRDSYIGVCHTASDPIARDMIMCDPEFTIQYKEDNSRNPLRRHTLVMSNRSRKLKIRGGDKRVMHEWLMSLQALRRQTTFLHRYQFSSFAPMRKHVQADWFVDGQDYFAAVADALDQAANTIYIADWWLSPEMYLKRPPATHQEYRLDRLLKRKAEEGVRVFVTVYKEVSLALTINSAHSKETLKSLHPNIMVQRHPDHGTGGTFLWAHHEKMLIVDDQIAFVGGLDLCFGRYDTHAHRLTDFDVNYDRVNDQFWPGQDYSNPRVKDFVNVDFHELELIDRRYVPRMPWHDVSMRVSGQAARDVSRHFVERWNFIKLDKGMVKENLPFLMPAGEFVSARDEDTSRGSCEVQVIRSSAMWSSGIEHELSIQTAYIDLIKEAKHFIYIENQFFSKFLNALYWQESVGLGTADTMDTVTSTTDDPEYSIKNRIGMALVERIIRAAKEQVPFRVIVVMPLMPGFEAEVDSKNANTLRMVMNYQFISIARGNNSIYAKLSEVGINPEEYISFFGLRNYDIIHAAKPNIVPDYDSAVDDPIHRSSASVATIETIVEDAGGNDGKSRVVADAPEYSAVALPSVRLAQTSTAAGTGSIGLIVPNAVVTPGAEVGVPVGGSAQPAVDERLKSAVRSADLQIVEGRQYITELVYIHTKLMIIDDEIAVCGSANINDRSMEGNRDSEVCIIVRDRDMIDSRMAGQECKVGRFAHTLRMQLMREHCGLLPEADMRLAKDFPTPSFMPSNFAELARESQLDGGLAQSMDAAASALVDPLSSAFSELWHRTASRNTICFREVFHCVPDDTVTTMEEYKQFVPDPDRVLRGHVADPDMPREQVEELLGQIRGHIVEFPNQFLSAENLSAAYFSAENLMPVELFI